MAIVIQQLALATGQLAPAMAAISVSNPFISVILGAALFQERLTRPGWHVALAALALFVSFAGAYMITAGNEDRDMPGAAAPEPPEPKATTPPAAGAEARTSR